MMIKAILTISAIIFGAGLLTLPADFVLANDNLVVEFQTTPLFKEANFLPGGSVSRWVKVTNNGQGSQKIAAETINESDPNNLGDVLGLEIREGEFVRYSGTFSQFFSAGEVFLSELAGNGTQAKYDFIVTFLAGGGNPFQGKSLGFDLLVGFQGTEGGGGEAGGGGGGGGGGGYFPPGLIIRDEFVTITTTTQNSVTIFWLTSYPSTSQIIYGKEGEAHTLNLSDNAGVPPKYGYERTTPEYDINPKVDLHTVTIDGLSPGTKYYFRAVSHGSLAISREYSFTTLGTAITPGLPLGEEIFEEKPIQAPPKEITIPGIIRRIPKPSEELKEIKKEIVIPSAPAPAPSIEVEKPWVPEGVRLPEEVIPAPSEKKIPERESSLMAATANLILTEVGNSAFLTTVLILSLFGLFLLVLRERKLLRRKRNEELKFRVFPLLGLNAPS